MEHKKNISRIKHLLEERMALSQLSRFLLSKGLSAAIVDEVIESVRPYSADKRLPALKEVLACRLKTIAGFAPETKCVALVGPTGVGKTTLILKLADHFRSNKRVALLSLDHEKGGAWAQLEKVAGKWQLPLFSQLPAFSDHELLLIDTSGCNTYETASVEGRGQQLAMIPNVQVHLTISASAKEVDLYGAIHQFSSLALTSLIVTKWDETLAPGAVINLSSRVDIPISFVAHGYPLPGHIEPANPHAIVHKILTGLNDEKFLFLRGLTIP